MRSQDQIDALECMAIDPYRYLIAPRLVAGILSMPLLVAMFVVAGIANMIVAPEIDPLGLQFSEDTWVDFKLFGLMGMTLAFVVAQAFYLARYMPNTDEETS